MDGSLAAAFDCNKAKSDIKKLICGDIHLTELDNQLNDAYANTLKGIGSSNKSALMQEQHNWIKYTRNSCDDAACLEQVYTARISLLKRNEKYIIDEQVMQVKVDGEMRNAVFQRDPNGRIESFN
jgi:uncharacterized protein